MTATTTTPVPVTTRTASGPTFGRVVASEWTKLASLRSPWWTAAVTVLVSLLITYLSAQASSVDPVFHPLSDVNTGLLLGQLGPLVLGVLVGAGEFRTGAFRSTFTVVPRRWPVLAAQTVVVGGFGLLLGVAVAVAGVLGVVPAAMARDVPVDLGADGTPGVLLGMVLYVAGLALLGFALGALLRRTVPALLTAFVLVLILPIVLMLADDPYGGSMSAADVRVTPLGTIGVLLPGTGGQLMTMPASNGPIDGSPDLGPVGGGLVLAAWVLAFLVAAAVRLRSRDVR